MNDDINSALLDALTKYGQRENICLKKNLKEGWDKYVSYCTVETEIDADINLRHRLVNQGRMLEEDLNNHYYYWLLQIKGLFAPEALVVTIRKGTTVHIGAYANQGLASKRFTTKAIEQVKSALK